MIDQTRELDSYAMEEGYDAGLQNKDFSENPYPADSQWFQEWEEGMMLAIVENFN